VHGLSTASQSESAGIAADAAIARISGGHHETSQLMAEHSWSLAASVFGLRN
jgi:hypothetical protein